MTPQPKEYIEHMHATKSMLGKWKKGKSFKCDAFSDCISKNSFAFLMRV